MSASSRYARPQLPSWRRYCSKRARAVTETAARAPAEASAYRRKALWLISGEPVPLRFAQRDEHPAGHVQVGLAVRLVAPGPAAIGTLPPDQAGEVARG